MPNYIVDSTAKKPAHVLESLELKVAEFNKKLQENKQPLLQDARVIYWVDVNADADRTIALKQRSGSYESEKSFDEALSAAHQAMKDQQFTVLNYGMIKVYTVSDKQIQILRGEKSKKTPTSSPQESGPKDYLSDHFRG